MEVYVPEKPSVQVRPVRPTVRHSQLAANLAGAMTIFLVDAFCSGTLT